MERMCWFKCDKGWFGVSVENEQLAKYAVYRLTGHEDEPIEISLFDIMAWAVQNSIPYEISTVEPK